MNLRIPHIIMVSSLIGTLATARAELPVQQIDAHWRFRQARHSNWYPATVPGVVHTDLMANGIIEDPYFRLNERGLQWIDKEDWIYETTFDADDAVFACDRIRLRFDGLDTYADVWLNDRQVLTANNMFRRWVVPVKPLLRKRGNVLRVYFHSPIKKALPLCDSLPYRYEAWNDQAANGGLLDKKLSPFTRKAGYHYGWDWGPRLVTSGIWRQVVLEGWNSLRIEDVFHYQKEVSAERASIETRVEVEAAEPAEDVRIAVYDGDRLLGERIVRLDRGINTVVVPFAIRKPRLWWCRGLGEQHRYTFRTVVGIGDRTLATDLKRVGLRSVRVEKERDAFGRSLRFVLNGVPVFCKGANYIPCDCFLPRITHETYERTVRDAAEVNMNMLRVWGGGIYEDDRFYDLCDSAGILVWQDFMYACSVYPARGEMLENMRLEAIDNVKRLRNHPSVVYWCGNNENQDSWLTGWIYDVRKTNPKYAEVIWQEYEAQYYRMLSDVVAEYAPGTGYQPSSPFSDYGKVSNDREGDRHYWEVWHARKPIAEYNVQRSRFFSEYGFQSFPCYETVKRYAPNPEDRTISSEVMMAHQRGGEHANDLIRSYLLSEYHEPRDFETFLYASQILQGDAIKTAIEAHRRDKGYCWGSLYWQHNDCWPVASWSSRDWYGTWKAQHYFARQAFDDLLVSPIVREGELHVYVVSDRQADTRGVLTVQAIRLEGGASKAIVRNVVVPANASTRLLTLDTKHLLGGIAPEEAVIRAELHTADKTYTNTCFLVRQKEMRYPEATVACDITPSRDGYDVTVRSEVFVRGLYLSVEDAHIHFSDNFFDLLPGESRTVHAATELPKEAFAARLKHLSLVDTY